MHWLIEEVGRALDAGIPPAVDRRTRVTGVSIDSRTIAPGELFFAITGPRFDGHSFIGAAFKAGAVAAVVRRGRAAELPEGVRGRAFEVDDALNALQRLGQVVRRAWGKRLVAVTGSVGKTTTKELLAAVLGLRFRVLKSEGNLNNEYGLPLALARLEPDVEAAVVELGMSHRGELRRLAEIAEPQVGVVTRVAPVHLEFFSSVDEIALAKRELIEGLRGSGTVAVLNADDERVARFAEVAPGRVLTFGFSSSADVRAENVHDRGVEGSAFVLVSGTERVPVELGLPGRHCITNALAAVAAADVWGIPASEAVQGLARLQPGEMRGRLIRFDEGFAVINDSYNSNPVALEAMTDLLARTPGYRRRILAAGEMLELGGDSAELHFAAGVHAARQGLDLIISVGGEAAKRLPEGAQAAGMSAAQVRFFSTSAEAGAFLCDLIQRGDLVLVKGSRGIKMEKIVQSLAAQHALAGSDAGESAAARH